MVNFINGLVEQCFEDPVPDVISHTDPSAIEFSHVFLEADSERNAYNRGWKMLPPRKRRTVANDYVVVVGQMRSNRRANDSGSRDRRAKTGVCELRNFSWSETAENLDSGYGNPNRDRDG